MPRGGKREGAGAKPRADSPTITRSVRFTMDEWETIKTNADYCELTPSEYIRRKVLDSIRF